MTRLTERRLEAMMTALTSMIAGWSEDQEGDAGDTPIEDLESAADWVAEEMARREARRGKPA